MSPQPHHKEPWGPNTPCKSPGQRWGPWCSGSWAVPGLCHGDVCWPQQTEFPFCSRFCPGWRLHSTKAEGAKFPLAHAGSSALACRIQWQHFGSWQTRRRTAPLGWNQIKVTVVVRATIWRHLPATCFSVSPKCGRQCKWYKTCLLLLKHVFYFIISKQNANV